MTKQLRLTPQRFMLAMVALMIALPLAHAGDKAKFESFSPERLEALQRDGKPVLVDVWADWCSTCRAQSPLIDALLDDEEFASYAALKLDWDAQREHAKELGAPRQSTLFVFRDGERVAMSIAQTDKDKLRELLREGLN